jgi:hypothetical protein
MDTHLSELPVMIDQFNDAISAFNAVAAGGAVSLQYTFSSTTTDADPTAGRLRLSSATQNASTTIRADLVGSDGSTLTGVLDLLDDSTSTNKGYLRLLKKDDANKWLIFSVTALASPSGYRNITVTPAAYSSASPFADGDELLFDFTPNGDKGDTGLTGTTGTHGGGIAIPYTFSTTTTDSDPGAGTLRLNNATQNASTVIRADLAASDAADWTGALDTLDASTSTVKGQIRLSKVGDGSKYIEFNLTARASPSGYRNLTVAVIGYSSANPFSNGDAVVLTFSRTGDAAVSGLVAASQAQMEAATDNTVAATPAGMQWHPGVAKFWLKCNTSGTISASHNITSITDTGVGTLTVTIATDFSGTNYCVVSDVGVVNANMSGAYTSNWAGGSFDARNNNDAGTPEDPGYWMLVGFGDQ